MIFEKNNKKKKWLAAFLSIVLVMVAFAGCGSDDDTSSDDNAKQEEVVGDIKVKLSIDFPDTEGQPDIEDKVVGMQSESSALDLLYAYANDNNLEVKTDGEDDLYVTEIGGVAENDSSGWVFTINDETIMVSSGKAMLKDGDEVEWEFTDWSHLEDD